MANAIAMTLWCFLRPLNFRYFISRDKITATTSSTLRGAVNKLCIGSFRRRTKGKVLLKEQRIPSIYLF